MFAGIGVSGPLAEAAFHVGPAAGDTDDRIIYDDATGLLQFDGDGTGPDAATTFAKLSKGLALTSGDFLVA